MRKRILAILVGLCLVGTQAMAAESFEAAELLEPVGIAERMEAARPFTRVDAERELQEIEESCAARYIVKLRPVQALAAGGGGLEAAASAVFQELREIKAEKIAEIEEKITEEIAEPVAMQRAAVRFFAPQKVTLSDWQSGYQLLTLPEAVEADAFLASLPTEDIEYIQPDYLLELQAEEELLEEAELAEPMQTADPALGAGVTVAVLDSGIDVTHPMLAGKVAGG